MSNNIQYRSFEPEKGELRSLMENDQMIIEGYAAKYNVRSHLLNDRGGKNYYEVLERGIFQDHLKDDVAFTYNHLKETVMAHTRNGSLTLSEDEIGLKFRAILNNTTDSKNLYERVSRGELVENSFGYRENPAKQKLDRVAGSDPTLRISGITNLFDVAVVTKGAYPNTEVYTRDLKEFEIEETPKTYDSTHYKRELELIKLKNNIN
jgi:HK97 family phage prohead protease